MADEFNNTIRMGVLSSPPFPVLQILLAAGQAVLSWPIAESNYVLETSGTLGSGASWTTLTNGLAISGDNYFLTNDVGPGPAFFRLRSQ